MRKDLYRPLLVASLLFADGCVPTPPTITPSANPGHSESFSPLQIVTATPREASIPHETGFTLSELQAQVDMSIAGDPNLEEIYKNEKPATKESPIPLPVRIGISPNSAVARYNFDGISAVESDAVKFNFVERSTGSKEPFKTYETLPTSVEFSDWWFNLKSDQVKKLILRKEANNVRMLEGFGRFHAVPAMLSLGDIEVLDPTLTSREVEYRVAASILSSNPDYLKLYDFAGYLSILREFEELEKSADPQIISDLLSVDSIRVIRDGARERGIRYEDVEFGSPEFFEMAFSAVSPWVNFINNDLVVGNGQ